MEAALTLAKRAYEVLQRDLPRLQKIDDYINGFHDPPYRPRTATAEFDKLMERSLTNWIPTLVAAPAQTMYLDSLRRKGANPAMAPSGDDSTSSAQSPEMEHFQRSGWDGRQSALYRASIGFGISYVLTYEQDGKSRSKALSPLRTVALYDDPGSDVDPLGALYVVRREGNALGKPGLVYWYDDIYRYELSLRDGEIKLIDAQEHGMSKCPVTRFAPWLDIEGRPVSMVEMLIPSQDRFNQTLFDLLMAQSYTANVVRTVTGMEPPPKLRKNDETGEMEVVFDSEGNPVPGETELNASRWMWAADPDVKFGSLPAGDLQGFLTSAEATLKHMSAISNVPPHFLMGQIANVSAEALQAAQTALLRQVDEIKGALGESWERVFRLAAELDGDAAAFDDTASEVIWRDVGNAQLSQVADALNKYKDLDVPTRGLWPMIPGVTDQTLGEWRRIRQEEDLPGRIARQATGSQVRIAQSSPTPATQTNPLPTPGAGTTQFR